MGSRIGSVFPRRVIQELYAEDCDGSVLILFRPSSDDKHIDHHLECSLRYLGI
jgi:hypothetical protein